MAQMERSAKKLPANLASRDFKAEAAKAKTPAERDRLLNLRTAKLTAMKKTGDKRTSEFAKGDEAARSAASARKVIADSNARLAKAGAKKVAPAKQAAAPAKQAAAPAKQNPLSRAVADVGARVRSEAAIGKNNPIDPFAKAAANIKSWVDKGNAAASAKAKVHPSGGGKKNMRRA